eukprot:6200606-Pleurochrysis_carterae.AAC.2
MSADIRGQQDATQCGIVMIEEGYLCAACRETLLAPWRAGRYITPRMWMHFIGCVTMLCPNTGNAQLSLMDHIMLNCPQLPGWFRAKVRARKAHAPSSESTTEDELQQHPLLRLTEPSLCPPNHGSQLSLVQAYRLKTSKSPMESERSAKRGICMTHIMMPYIREEGTVHGPARRIDHDDTFSGTRSSCSSRWCDIAAPAQL